MKKTAVMGLYEILRDFDPDKTVVNVIVDVGDAFGFKKRDEEYAKFVDNKLEELEAYIATHTKPPINPKLMPGIIGRWVGEQRAFIQDIYKMVEDAEALAEQESSAINSDQGETMVEPQVEHRGRKIKFQG